MTNVYSPLRLAFGSFSALMTAQHVRIRVNDGLVGDAHLRRVLQRNPGTRADGFRLRVQEAPCCGPAVCFGVSHCSAAAVGCGFVVDPDGLDRLARRRQVDDQRAAEDRIGLLQVKRPAHPDGLVLGGGAQHVGGLLAHVVDVKSLVSSTSCVARGSRRLSSSATVPLDAICPADRPADPVPCA